MQLNFQNSSLQSPKISQDQPSQLIAEEQREQVSLEKVDRDHDAWSSALTHLLDRPPASMPLKLIVGGSLFLFAFIMWAWFSRVDQLGVAHGKLIPLGEAYKVETAQAGKVSRIAVREGESVKAGQTIAELDADLVQSEVDRLSQQLNALHRELDQKKVLYQKSRLELRAQGRIAATEAIGHQYAVKSAQNNANMLENLIQRQQQERDVLHQRQTRLVSLKDLSDLRSAELISEINSHKERMQRLTRLEAQGAISKEAVFSANQGLRQTQKQFTESKLNRISSVNEQIFQAEQALRNLDTEVLQRQGELLATSTQIQQLQLDLDIKESDIVRLELEAQQKLNLLQQDITRIQAQIDETQKLLEASVVQLDRRILKAPINGVVLLSHLKNTGKVIQPGQTVAEIAPHSSPLIVQARLPNREAGFVEVGMPVQIKMDAYPFQEYGVIPGKLLSISSDAVTDEQLGEVYLVDVQLEQDYVTENKKKIYFKPGQTAVASIQIRQRRILNMMLDPIRKLQ